MPDLTKEQLKNIKYVSIADLYQQLDAIQDFDDKFQFTVRYLLSHGSKGQATDYSFEEAVHLARLKLIDESKKLRDKLLTDEDGVDPADIYFDENEYPVYPYAEEEKDDIEYEFFMGNPGEYLKCKADKVVRDIESQDFEDDKEVALKENCNRLSKTLGPGKSYEILSAEEKGQNILNIQARMEAKCRGRDIFQKLEKETKPGFLARNFGTRSTAGKNFDEVYAAFKNPGHVLYGNMDALKKASDEYVAYKDSKKSSLERVAGLAIEDPKEAFARRISESIAEQKANDEVFKPIVGTCVKKKLTQDIVDRIKGPELSENQHRAPIDLDLDEEESEIDNSMESESELDLSEDMEKEADM